VVSVRRAARFVYLKLRSRHRRLYRLISMALGPGGTTTAKKSNTKKFEAIRAALAAKKGVRAIARDLKTGVGTVLRVKAETV
jgi:hypothetical protein